MIINKLITSIEIDTVNIKTKDGKEVPKDIAYLRTLKDEKGNNDKYRVWISTQKQQSLLEEIDGELMASESKNPAVKVKLNVYRTKNSYKDAEGKMVQLKVPTRFANVFGYEKASK